MCIQVKRQNKKNSSRSSSPRLGTVAPPPDIGFILLRRTKACQGSKRPSMRRFQGSIGREWDV